MVLSGSYSANGFLIKMFTDTGVVVSKGLVCHSGFALSGEP